MPAIKSYSTKRLFWELFDENLKCIRSSYAKDRPREDFNLMLTQTWCLRLIFKAAIGSMALQGFSFTLWRVIYINCIKNTILQLYKTVKILSSYLEDNKKGYSQLN